MPRRRARALLVALPLCLCLLPGPTPAEEFIYLGAGPILGDRARQVRTTVTPPAGWAALDFDDSTWPAPMQAPPPPPPGQSPPDGGDAGCAGTVYLRRRFDVGPELGRLASLALRL